MANETVQLAEYAAGLRYDDLSPSAAAAAKDCIIDTVAACICGSALPWSRIVIEYAERTGPGGASRILGAGSAVQAPAAALANGALAHAFELDSLTRPGAGAHPGATVLPPALGVAQQPGMAPFISSFRMWPVGVTLPACFRGPFRSWRSGISHSRKPFLTRSPNCLPIAWVKRRKWITPNRRPLRCSQP